LIKPPLKAENIGVEPHKTATNLTLREDAYSLARGIFKSQEIADNFANHLLDVCAEAEGKDFIIVHNPGGWGHARLDQCLEWERSIVFGVKAVVEEMGYSFLLTQYFRSGLGWAEDMRDLGEQFRFFSSKADIIAAWLKFIISHVNGIKVILIGISQGAAFGNSVMQQLGGRYPVYSLELGFPFQYKSRRVITERTLAVEDNGVEPDILAQGNIWAGAGILMAAPFKWMWYYLRGKPVEFAHCVSAPGHEYDWSNPEIQRRIRDFLEANFGARDRGFNSPTGKY
jgi:pimeloyl-ACP methyl ester carboxylesterase